MVLISTVTVVSLAVTAVYLLLSILLGFYLGRRKNLPNKENWIISWHVFDALIHFTLEGSFVVLSLLGTVDESNHFTAHLWKEYALADKRWGVSDPTIVSLEMLTVFIDGPLCLLLIWAIYHRTYNRHYVQLVLCVCELYGGWMTFCPEWLTGSQNLDTSNFLYLWVYLVFFNGIWVAVPLYLMWDSWFDMQECFMPKDQAKAIREMARQTDKTRSVSTTQHRYNTRSRKLE